ncbi:MAG: 50S ribosomal protein L19 [Armatimonadetes bacterium]|jgi:large subunit ribosomal protein L19|nr:50S ribosomal protein L19 [Armatimonadota bacterium]NLN89728.1 50S ribosomal protein L19 [candidate division WS1 bacterium]
MDIIAELEKEQARQTPLPDMRPGDTVRVHYRVREGQRERTQIFEGTVLQIRGGQASRRNFTVRRVSGGVGVERIFPVDSPRVETVEVTRRGSVRRARLYYLRDRIGKRAKVREQHRAVDEAQTMEKRAARKARRDDRRQAIRNKRDARKQAQTAAPSAPAAEPSQQEE